jgi:phosphoglycolate phosphatase
MIKLVIFDYDDTLCLTEEGCYIMENQIGIDMGFAPMCREVHKKTWGEPIREIITERIPGINVEEFIKIQEESIPKYVKLGVLDNIPEKNLKTIDNIIELGKSVAIQTSRRYGELKHILESDHPLNNRIKDIKHKDNSEFHKPDPKVFDIFFKQYSVKPHEVVYVGDSIKDGIASKGASVWFVASLESGLRSKEDFNDIDVDFFINDFIEIEEVIKKIDNM